MIIGQDFKLYLKQNNTQSNVYRFIQIDYDGSNLIINTDRQILSIMKKERILDIDKRVQNISNKLGDFKENEVFYR